jgi:hypothetical protein
MPASPELNLATAAFEVVWTPGFVQPDPDLTILTTLIIVYLARSAAKIQASKDDPKGLDRAAATK